MSEDRLAQLDVSAAEARSHLVQLQAERGLAVLTGLAGVQTYLGDLDEEIELWRSLYAFAAVTEIATLRAELFGAQVG